MSNDVKIFLKKFIEIIESKKQWGRGELKDLCNRIIIDEDDE